MENAFQIAIKVSVQKYMVPALKEIVSKTVMKTSALRLEENVSQVYVYLNTKQTLTGFKGFSLFRITVTSTEKLHIGGEFYLRDIFTR